MSLGQQVKPERGEGQMSAVYQHCLPSFGGFAVGELCRTIARFLEIHAKAFCVTECCVKCELFSDGAQRKWQLCKSIKLFQNHEGDSNMLLDI